MRALKKMKDGVPGPNGRKLSDVRAISAVELAEHYGTSGTQSMAVDWIRTKTALTQTDCAASQVCGGRGSGEVPTHNNV